MPKQPNNKNCFLGHPSLKANLTYKTLDYYVINWRLNANKLYFIVHKKLVSLEFIIYIIEL